MPIKAILEDGWFLCGCCGHKLARCTSNTVTITNKYLQDTEVQEIDKDTVSLEIKCKHKSSGKKCDTVNVIEI